MLSPIDFLQIGQAAQRIGILISDRAFVKETDISVLVKFIHYFRILGASVIEAAFFNALPVYGFVFLREFVMPQNECARSGMPADLRIKEVTVTIKRIFIKVENCLFVKHRH